MGYVSHVTGLIGENPYVTDLISGHSHIFKHFRKRGVTVCTSPNANSPKHRVAFGAVEWCGKTTF